MMRKLVKMQSKNPLAVSIANPNQDLTEIPLAKSKGNEIGRKEFDEESFFYQEPPPRAPARGGSEFPDGGTARREFYGGGSGTSDNYGRHFGQGNGRPEMEGVELNNGDQVMQEGWKKGWISTLDTQGKHGWIKTIITLMEEEIIGPGAIIR
ncbi:hypothetical protein IEQ34_005485 [Dendrobium chrysotoxum]|uniref:Uncharacterized protein n=1 Tax=Dendrobium chrysotoxum TaxID=161865 RepID=A0AAV7HAA8_DENCH|nr:hypothetical protein IEQ34_005485 [Dendrobium chrysotoxum]